MNLQTTRTDSPLKGKPTTQRRASLKKQKKGETSWRGNGVRKKNQGERRKANIKKGRKPSWAPVTTTSHSDSSHKAEWQKGAIDREARNRGDGYSEKTSYTRPQ